MNPLKRFYDLLITEGAWDDPFDLKRNAHLCEPGSVSDKLYFVDKGSLRIYRIEGDEEQTIRFGYHGSFVTSLDSFLTGEPTTYYIQAIKRSRIRAIGKQKIMSLLDRSPDHLKLWIGVTEQLILQQMEREQDLLTASPADRYERVLKRSPQLFQEIPARYIASYLRMTPETLSRLKKS